MTAIAPEIELEAVRDWKRIGIALAAACGAVEAKLLAENPHLALRSTKATGQGSSNHE